jgi:hypothetical protein
MAVNYAASANGGVATASSTTTSGHSTGSAINGDRTGTGWGVPATGGWNDATADTWPDWLQVDFTRKRSISEIDVFTLQDAYGSPSNPTVEMTFTSYGIVDFLVQYWDGDSWVTVPGGNVVGNNKVWRSFTFPTVWTDKVRVYVTYALGNFSRIVELEAWGVLSQYQALNPIGVRLEEVGWAGSRLRADFGNGYGVKSNVGAQSGLHSWNMVSAGIWLDTLDQLTVEGVSRFEYYWDFFKRHTTGADDVFVLDWGGSKGAPKKWHASFVDSDISVAKFKNQLIYNQGGIPITQRRLDHTRYNTDGSIAWTPSDLGQIVGRWKAMEILGVANNTPIDSWVDMIGTSNAVASGTARPLFKQNVHQPYLYFDGVNDFMDTGITIPFGDFAAFVVFRMRTLGTGIYRRIIDKNSNTGFWVGLDGAAGNQFGGGIGEAAPPWGHYISGAANTWYAMLIQRSGTTKTIRMNGGLVTQTVSSTAMDSSPFRIGGSQVPDSFGDIDVKEVFLCGDNLVSKDLTSLGDYALKEYGLVL